MDWLEILITAIPDFIEEVADIIITATPQFLGDCADLIVRATPSWGEVAVPAMAVVSGFFLLFMMEADV